MDGTADAGNLEDELVVITYSFKSDSTKEITTNARYWSIHNPERADAGGLLLCIKDALKPLGVSDLLEKASALGVQNMPVLVGGSSDGASVNMSELNGVRGQLQKALPWLFWSWCFAHILELGCLCESSFQRC